MLFGPLWDLTKYPAYYFPLWNCVFLLSLIMIFSSIPPLFCKGHTNELRESWHLKNRVHAFSSVDRSKIYRQIDYSSFHFQSVEFWLLGYRAWALLIRNLYTGLSLKSQSIVKKGQKSANDYVHKTDDFGVVVPSLFSFFSSIVLKRSIFRAPK